MKPLIHIWPVNSQEQIQGSRFVMPGKITALAISPDGNYCVAAVTETVHIWEICSGRMVAVLSQHYQSVTSIKFTDDGTHFCTAAHDGMLLVWKLASVLAVNSNISQQVTPLYSFSDHALPITDIYISKGGMRAWLASVSLDRTCKIYDLSNGVLLLNVVFPEPLTSVTIDHMDSWLYVGTAEGNIYEFNLQSPPRMKEYHMTEANTKNKFVGHKGSVTTLSISLDGVSMISGGNDENVLLWHIRSKQLIRTLPHKGAVTNAFFTLASKAMFNQETKLTLITNNFKRMLDNNTSNDDHVVEVLVKRAIIETTSNTPEPSIAYCPEKPKEDQLLKLENLQKENIRLHKVNMELFEFATKYVLSKKK